MKYIRYSGYLNEAQNEKLNEMVDKTKISKARILAFLLDSYGENILPKAVADRVDANDFNRLLSALNEFKAHTESSLSDLHQKLLISQNELNLIKGSLTRSESLSDCSDNMTELVTTTIPDPIKAIAVGTSFSNKELIALFQTVNVSITYDDLKRARSQGDYSKLPIWFSNSFKSVGVATSSRWYKN